MAKQEGPGQNEPDRTLADPPPVAERGQADVDPGVSGELPVEMAASMEAGGSFAERYEERSRIGAGGMGEVIEFGDRRIGRRIALKVAWARENASPDALTRFVREARLQGQLEHPAIVPVYDVAEDEAGRLYFTMKRVDGITLKDVIARLRKGNAEMRSRFSRRKLLSAFVTVCQAVDYAHSRGVIHRDLKPSNVMLGRFGEVYLLDWGVAKVVGSEEPVTDSSSGQGDGTRTGAFLGTTGYAAPEQVRATAVDERADVYGLGAILFEMLALTPLHGGDSIGRAESTIDGANARASVRAPEREVPPELEAVCVRATRTEPTARYASVRALYEEVERFLEGESNLQLRRELAAAHAESARVLATEALREEGGVGLRREAMAEVGRALAMDPSHDDAARTMMTLLETPPATPPPQVREELEEVRRHEVSWTGRVAAFAYGSFFLFIPLLIWMGVRDLWSLVATFTTFGLATALSAHTARRLGPWGPESVLAVSNIGAGLAACLFGPFVIVPAMAATNSLTAAMQLSRGARWFAAITGSLAIVIPFALEVVGVLPPSFVFTGSSIAIQPRAVDFEPTATLTVLLVASVAAVLLGVLVVSRLREDLTTARRQLLIQAWHLRVLFPTAEHRRG